MKNANIVLLFIILCTFISCDKKKDEKSEENKLLGTWTLSNTTIEADTIFVKTSWITFGEGNSFNCNSGFFFTNDSTRLLSKSGTYSVWIESDPLRLGKGEHGGEYLDLQVDSITKSWALYCDETTMTWSSQYTWTKKK